MLTRQWLSKHMYTDFYSKTISRILGFKLWRVSPHTIADLILFWRHYY
jgi:hypothetical protein